MKHRRTSKHCRFVGTECVNHHPNIISFIIARLRSTRKGNVFPFLSVHKGAGRRGGTPARTRTGHPHPSPGQDQNREPPPHPNPSPQPEPGQGPLPHPLPLVQDMLRTGYDMGSTLLAFHAGGLSCSFWEKDGQIKG